MQALGRMETYAMDQQTQRLRYVFSLLDTEGQGKIGTPEITVMLRKLGCEARQKGRDDRETVREALQREVPAPADMVWEVDEDGDGMIAFEEFTRGYERAVRDRSGREPRKLYMLVEFLLLDEGDKGWITVDSILNLMMMRKVDMADAIRSMFDDGSTGVRQITFQEYCLAGGPPTSGTKTGGFNSK
eukprot:COSAG01_NODE_3784_length_5697_cov_2.188817_1_plen_187_part_00